MRRLRAQREEKLSQKKKTFPLTILAIILWGACAFVILFIDPDAGGAVIFFLLLLFVSLYLTLSLVLSQFAQNFRRRSFLISFGATAFLALSVIGLGNWLNLFLLFGILATIEYYFSKL